MILVDTSVWIDFLQGAENSATRLLKKKIDERESLAFTGLILLEILQGIERPADREKIKSKFDPLIELHPQRTSYRLAAEIYQKTRREGHTIRSVIDCLIAALALESNATILHKDRDFKRIADYFPLTIAN